MVLYAKYLEVWHCQTASQITIDELNGARHQSLPIAGVDACSSSWTRLINGQEIYLTTHQECSVLNDWALLSRLDTEFDWFTEVKHKCQTKIKAYLHCFRVWLDFAPRKCSNKIKGLDLKENFLAGLPHVLSQSTILQDKVLLVVKSLLLFLLVRESLRTSSFRSGTRWR